jgi:hypothetical protein
MVGTLVNWAGGRTVVEVSFSAWANLPVGLEKITGSSATVLVTVFSLPSEDPRINTDQFPWHYVCYRD